MDTEQTIMELIVYSGDARSTAMEAISHAGKGRFSVGEELIRQAEKIVCRAHEIQTELIQREINGEKTEISLLMIHAQDHLMNAMTVIDLAKMMINIMKERK